MKCDEVETTERVASEDMTCEDGVNADVARASNAIVAMV
jgi:hypothetical protein